MLEFDEFDRLLAEYKAEFGDDLGEELKAGRGADDLLRRIVLGFIWANPSNGSDERERLAQALTALTGRPHRVQVYDDESVLEAMAEARSEDEQRQRGDPTFKRRSDRELAKHFGRLLKSQHSQDATEERLRKAFAKRQAELIQTVDDRAVAVEVLRRYVLADLEVMLARFGIQFFGEN